MKFEIAQIVIYNNDLNCRYLILATKEQNLSLEYLKSKSGIFYIKSIEEIAKRNLSVNNGFEYKLGKIIGSENGYSIVGEFRDAFENDLKI